MTHIVFHDIEMLKNLFRVLDLNRVALRHIPQDLRDFNHLRYQRLRLIVKEEHYGDALPSFVVCKQCNIEMGLLSSLSSFGNLETLDLSDRSLNELEDANRRVDDAKIEASASFKCNHFGGLRRGGFDEPRNTN
ncbi:hypothetical protein AMTR_s00039p00222970 [Amborella trichopoda]|uniref:Uncharacterized protein n=1 Tax=Amborella trichopoda TaxID=13333 RepID=U5D3B5_AMBTC|nr:hypothetical protein AMTR_s00039p00222970 [Amborella trichopoda]